MENQDRNKGCLSCVFYLLAFVLPAVGLVAGWVGWDFKSGVLASVLTFGAFFTLGSIFTIWIKTPSWFMIMLPAIIGLLYSLFNFLPLPFDDVLVASAGAIISAALAWIKFADMPKWALLPLFGAALYTLVGEFIPTPVDDLLVDVMAIGITSTQIPRRYLPSSTSPQP